MKEELNQLKDELARYYGLFKKINGGTNINIIVKTPLYDTEDREKVEQCLRKILDDLNIEEEKMDDQVYLIMKSTDRNKLSLIRDKLRQQRIRDSARKILFENMKEDSVFFFLNKQAAVVGKVHFVKELEHEDFLGPITILITSDKIKDIIDWLTSDNYRKFT